MSAPEVPGAATTAIDPLSRDLNSWFEYLEQLVLENLATVLSRDRAQALLARIRAASLSVGRSYQPVDRNAFKHMVGDLPTEKTMPEELHRLLYIVWNDYRLWQCAHCTTIKPPPGPLAFSFLQHSYGLIIPFADSVWLELRDQPSRWGYLRDLMVISARHFFPVKPPLRKEELLADHSKALSKRFLATLIQQYTLSPGIDWRPWLSMQKLPASVLDRLTFVGKRIAKDAAWVKKHPSRSEARRATSVPHRLRSVKEADTMQQMVDALREDPKLSDYGLAKRCLKGLSSAGRRLAKEARLLALYRDRLPVEFHKSRGHKPPPT